ncbi:MAG: DUF1993 domain-containing protein [Burkholderiaceae bacterium]|nr:MAG: DUF1993 domain-containing protein [Burkholderiaceae bacterium]
MSLTMYTASMPAMKRMLSNLAAILTKAEEYAASKKIDPSVLLGARLYPNMFPLLRQVLIASDHAKGCAARLAGIDVPKYEDKETSFAELQARIAKTIDFIDSVRPEQFVGSEERDIELKAGPNMYQFKGQDYLNQWALPNFYFHLTTAYAILRHNGLEIGKSDYLGGR